ncbi:MAG: ABC transporter permease [Xenococcaceae cyanobacterium]
MVSIARKNLLEDIPRFLVAQAGIMFAVSLVTIQTGILNGFTRSTVLLIEGSEADIWMTSDEMVHFELTDPLIMAQLDEARQVEGVERAEALIIGSGRWRPPGAKSSPLRLIGFDPEGQLFQPGKLTQGSLSALKQPYTVMVDQTRLPALHMQEIGDTGKVDSLPAQLVALTQEAQSIVAPPFFFTSLENANTYVNAGFISKINCKLQSGGSLKCTRVYEKSSSSTTADELDASPPQPLNLTDPITYVLVEAKPGQDIEALKQSLEAALPEIRAYTKTEMAKQTRTFWKGRTGIGWVLGLGAVVGVIVGMVVVTQILYSSVSDHIKEFGTLKAMGASDGVLYSVILEQSLWMAVLGYIPGTLLCWGLSIWAATKGIIILISPGAAAGVFGIVVMMCIGSGFFAIQKVIHVDPAIVFKA